MYKNNIFLDKVQNHLEIYATKINLVLIFGAAPSSTQLLYSAFSRVWSDRICFSFFVFCYFVIKIILSLFYKEKKKIYFGLYCLFFINLWPITSTGNFFNNWISILIYIPISFYILNLDKDKKDNV